MPAEINAHQLGAGKCAAFLGTLRSGALIAVLVGAVVSAGLVLREGPRPPRFLLVLFVFGVLSPFMAAVLAEVISKRWPLLTRAPLPGVSLVFTLGSLAIYGAVALGFSRARPAAVFLLVPLATWVLI